MPISKIYPKINLPQKLYPSVRPSSSMAEENKVKNFNLFNTKQNDSILPTNKPQRIELPVFFNTPIRNTTVQTRKIRSPIQNLSYQVDQIDESPKDIDERINVRSMTNQKQYYLDIYLLSQKVTQMATFLSSHRRLKDYELLAFACRRAGKQRDEGRAYFSMGILNDNIGEWRKAIECYKKFLAVCQTIGDIHGEGLAYNCIGVDYLLLSEEFPNLIPEAISYHKRHEDISDVNGKFLSSINLGLCYDKMDDQKHSLFHYQNGLKYAMKMSNIVGQSIAIGNIAKIGTKGLYDNTDKMKIFVEKYIKLAQDLSDNQGQVKGNVKLGMLSANRGDYQEGKSYFLKALHMTNQVKDAQIYQSAKCGYAVSNAECSMQNYLSTYVQNIHQI